MTLSRIAFLLVVGVVYFWTGINNLSIAEIPSGPQAGTKVTPLKLEALPFFQEGTSSQNFESLDPFKSLAEKPILFFFIQANKWDRPMARLLKKMDQDLRNHSAQAEIIAIWLTDSPQTSKDVLSRAANSLKMEHTRLALFPENTSLPSDWKIDPAAHVTVVITRGEKPVDSIGFTSTNDTDLPRLVQGLEKALEKK